MLKISQIDMGFTENMAIVIHEAYYSSECKGENDSFPFSMRYTTILWDVVITVGARKLTLCFKYIFTFE